MPHYLSRNELTMIHSSTQCCCYLLTAPTRVNSDFTSYGISTRLELFPFVLIASLDSTELTYSTKAQAGRQPQQDTPSSSAKRLSGMNSVHFIHSIVHINQRDCFAIDTHKCTGEFITHKCKYCNRQLKSNEKKTRHRETISTQSNKINTPKVP